MTATLSEHAMARGLAYLGLCGIPLTREVMISLLGLIQEALAEDQGEQDLPERVMTRLAARFPLPDPQVPPICPPMQRGSLGYGP